MHISRAEEASLVARAKLGDADAFNCLTKNCYSKIRNYIASQRDLFYEYEDITQDVFLEAFKSMASFNGLSLFSTWVRGIAYNLVNHRRRKQKSSVCLVPLFDDIRFDKDPLNELEYEQLSEKLSLFIDSLSPKEKLVFSLKVLDANSYNSICQQTHQKADTCRKTFKRARAKWKKFIRKEFNQIHETIIPDKEH